MDSNNTNTPMTTEFKLKEPVPIDHEWVQRGNDLLCESCDHPHSSINAVPFGMMLTRTSEGKYDFTPLT